MKVASKTFAVVCVLQLWTSLWISHQARAWGELGHRIVAEYGTSLVSNSTLANCHITAAELVGHTNDPDKIWRQKKKDYPNEGFAHYIHVDRQPKDWRTRKDAEDKTQGFLVYRIVDWIDEAKKARGAKDWDKLAHRLYGLSHYLGDLSQPLHLHHDHDGEEAGLPDLHAQFETRMINRYEEEARDAVKENLEKEGIPAFWGSLDLRNLIFDTAQQTYAKAPKLFENASAAFQIQKTKKKSKKPQKARFVKKILWEKSGALAVDQLTISAKLWAHVLNSVCK
jgi:hypothetical protein